MRKIEFIVIGDMTFYKLKNKKEHKEIVKKLNKQLGFDWHKVEEVTYPYELVVDAQEQLYRKHDVKNKYHAINQEEYDACWMEDVKQHVEKLFAWVKKHEKATFHTCKRIFKETFNEEYENEKKYSFDFYYGPLTQTLTREGKGTTVKLCKTLELYDDDFSGGSGEFKVSDKAVEEIKEYWKTKMGTDADAYMCS